jgi:GntR family transcriptional regulator/MocR family aminotransferase
MDLDIPLDRSAPTLLPQQIARGVIDLIVSGAVPRGAALPASRALADHLGVGRLTVVEAYRWLAEQGYVAARRGSKTIVQDVGAAPSLPATAIAPTPAKESDKAAIDFRPGRPDLDAFPRRRWTALQVQASRTLPAGAFDYGEPFGHPPLRRSIAAYLQRSRGLTVPPERIVITAGNGQGVDLILRALPDHRELVCEAPGHLALSRLPDIHSIRRIRTPVDAEGLVTDGLPPADGVRRLALVTPSHQFPTGVMMSVERRRALINWAQQTDAMILEDDYDSEFAYDGRPAVPLAKLDRTGRVIYMGTFSKTLAPGLRLGFMVAPEPMLERLAALKWWVDWGGGVLQQAALATWIDNGGFEKHLQRMRRLYRERCSLLTAALSEALGSRVRFLDVSAGMHFTALLRSPFDAEEIARRAEADGVRLHPLVGTAPGQAQDEAAFVLGFGDLSAAQIVAGAQVLALHAAG